MTFRASRPTVRRSRNCCFSSGGRNRTYGLLIQSQASLPTATTPEWLLHIKSALRELNPPRQLGRLAPLPLGQGHAQRKERESNPQGSSLDRFRDGCHRPLACPSVTSCGGRNRTCVGALNSRLPVPTRPHRNRVGAVGFEPTISCSRSRRNCQAFPRRCKSAQRESNPHIRHGKAVGCRYIMGACFVSRFNCQRTISEHRAGLEPASPHYGCGILAARRPVLCCQWDQRDSNPHLSG